MAVTAANLSTFGGIATVSLVHSLIPTHWLPFSVVGRVQKWTIHQTLSITALGAFLHVLSTSILGFTAVTMAHTLAGEEAVEAIAASCFAPFQPSPLSLTAALGAFLHVLSTSILGFTAVTMAHTLAGEEAVEAIASLLLLLLGACYIALFLLTRGKPSHSHCHAHAHLPTTMAAAAAATAAATGTSSPGGSAAASSKSANASGKPEGMERIAVLGLVLVPALSPCATTLPVFLAISDASVGTMAIAVAVLLACTLFVMLTLVALSFYGASQVSLLSHVAAIYVMRPSRLSVAARLHAPVVMLTRVGLSYGASQVKFGWLERYEKLVVGVILCAVGILTHLFHHHDHPHGHHSHGHAGHAGSVFAPGHTDIITAGTMLSHHH
ncbi:unnamed protein product [Closterium sp. NIES-64]|nr:unnamed protein product [Closterium sp. NIES-64]CAI6007654.1 unnamed protein product [Closterium sp. NIES-65]